jgi:hypothetical protein
METEGKDDQKHAQPFCGMAAIEMHVLAVWCIASILGFQALSAENFR